MSDYAPKDPADRLLIRISELESKVKEQALKPLIVPTLAADPGASQLINLWYLTDGRLRGRLIDGTIVEYSQTTHLHDARYVQLSVPEDPTQGGSNSTADPPAVQPTPVEYTFDDSPAWAQSYRLGGSQQRSDAGDFLYYGRISSIHGEQKSMIGWNDLTTTLAGSRISLVELDIENHWTNFNSGASLNIGFHNNSSAPGAFEEVRWDPITKHVNKAGQSGPLLQTYGLDNWVGELFRDGSVKGITFNQHSTDASFYGYSTRNIRLRIKYIK